MDEDGPAPRTRMSAARRRESILRAAVQVFAASGYRATTVADVARRVGVTEPVVFQNFGSKAALFAATLDHAAEQASAWLARAHGDGGPALAPLAHVLGPPERDHGAAGPAGDGEPAAALRLLFLDATSLAGDPALAEVSGRALRTLAGHLTDVVRHGQDDGSLAADLDPRAAAWLLISVLAARPLRTVAGAGDLEPQLAALAARALGASPTGTPPGHPAHG